MKIVNVKEIKLKDTKEIRRIYKENFPKVERVLFNKLYSGVFADFKMYGFFNANNEALGFVHLINMDEFVHVNYIAVEKAYHRKGLGTKFIEWVKKEFNKPIVVDVENFDLSAKNIEERARRLKFYYKNGFNDGDKEFDWAGTKMFYMTTGKISDKKFMTHIVKCFPTISNIKTHKSNKEKLESYLKNSSKIGN